MPTAPEEPTLLPPCTATALEFGKYVTLEQTGIIAWSCMTTVHTVATTFGIAMVTTGLLPPTTWSRTAVLATESKHVGKPNCVETHHVHTEIVWYPLL